MPASTCEVIAVRSLVANAFLVRGERTVIVDTGNTASGRRMLRRLERLGIAPRSVSLILLTHGHLDHFGSLHELKAATGAPLAIHALDAHAVRAGRNPPLVPRSALGHVLKPFFQHRRIAPCEPDLLVDESTDLAPFGIGAKIIATPGHTPGSISLLVDDGQLLAGDLLLGGFLGGHFASGRPGLPYFYDDLGQTRQSIARILTLPLTRIHVGHGGPLDPADVRRVFANDKCDERESFRSDRGAKKT